MMRQLRASPVPDRVIGVIAGSLGIMVTVAAAWVLYAVVYTPTTTLYVRDDLGVAASISVCSSDPLDLEPGDTVPIDPNVHDSNGACAVYADGPSFHYAGCLPVPTTTYGPGTVVALSRFNRRTPVDSCGD
jgi:hypothetical protein